MEPALQRRVVLLGVLALCLGIGGLRFTYAARLFFNQNTQTYLTTKGEIRSGPRPWPEPWLLTYSAAAAGIMLAGGASLLLKRPWGLTVAAFAGFAWIISAVGYLVSRYRFLDGARRWIPSPSVWLRPGWLLELGLGFVVLAAGVLFVTLHRRPEWTGLPAGSKPVDRRLAVPAVLTWVGISIAASMMFFRWTLERLK